MGNGSGDSQFKVLAKVTELDERLDRLEGRMDQLDGRMDRFEGRMDRFEGRMDRFETELVSLRGDMDDMVPAVHQILATQNLLIEGFQHFGDHERRIQVLERLAEIRK